MKRKRTLARLVSQENFCSPPEASTKGSAGCSPRSVSEAAEQSNEKRIPSMSMQQVHVSSLRLEAELYPMRLILSRLMGHQTHNRKGLFNVKVDAEALGLRDYYTIVKRPMDLGSVKKKLHAVVYQSRQEAADEIRLVFMNAMRYNPPLHPVHEAAKALLIYFEEAMLNLEGRDKTEIYVPSLTPSPPEAPCAQGSLTRTVSTLEGDMADDDTSTHPSIKEGASHLPPLKLDPITVHKKPSRLPPFAPHACGTCQGRTCQLCQQGCLYHEPALLVCQGVHCSGARLRKGATYYVTADGNRHFCERCYSNLTPVLSDTSESDPCRYKQDLLKRQNNEEIAEKWIECASCNTGVHSICALHNGFLSNDDSKQAYVCLDCQDNENQVLAFNSSPSPQAYTFVSGQDTPVHMDSLGSTFHTKATTAEQLPECNISSFIQAKVEKKMQEFLAHSDKTITVRTVSDSSRDFAVPEVVRRHFYMATADGKMVSPPSQVKYRQKAITLFQKIDGLDVCIFCMYVQEYDGEDTYPEPESNDCVQSSHTKRVYIAYIDSVEHFRPRECRTEIYHEILVAYLATARARGYQAAHIWACPPSRGNSFVFWNHPSSQRTPNQERLIQWYHGALSKAVDKGVVTDVKSLYETDFEKNSSDSTTTQHGKMICPPLFDGDFWIEEAVRVHTTTKARSIKVRATNDVCVWNVTPLLSSELDPCPALQIAALVKDRLMTHPSSVPFRRPVNAAALKLNNYHKIVTKPMDLGTIYAQCVIGEYQCLSQVVRDVILMVSNAKTFNPAGHFVHTKAEEILSLFYKELTSLSKIWDQNSDTNKENIKTWEKYADMSMSLDHRMSIPPSPKQTTSMEDDDGTRSTNSVSIVSIPSLPSSPIKEDKDMTEKLILKKQDDCQTPIITKPKRQRSMSTGGKKRQRGRRGSLKSKLSTTPKKLNILLDGPEAVMHNMVGDDHWLLDKRNTSGCPPDKGLKRPRSTSCASNIESTASIGDQLSNRRRQAWIGDEVADSVRRMRTSFFTCSLVPKTDKSEIELQKDATYEVYIKEFERSDVSDISSTSCPITEARHALLEFSQYRNFEFDTLRRAKHSTAMLLHYFTDHNAPGLIPLCTSCGQSIEEVRWHKVKKASEKRRMTKFMKPTTTEPKFIEEELCQECFTKMTHKQDFIPIPVSFKN